ncbi:MAG TPA: HEAT repeat domain-containing protein [Longimicrobium sp.]|nr:HEAT repeat domain-containing protein [Longimicrobium sp.]
MSQYDWLALALWILGAMFASGLLMFFGHGAWMVLYERRTADRLERGRRVLVDLTATGRIGPSDIAMLKGLPRRLQVRLFVELATYLSGAQRQHLAALAREVGLAEAGARLCRDRAWWKRLRGVRLLTVIGGGEAAVPPLLDDRHPAVRAEATEWAGEHPSPAVIERLVASLADPGRLGSYELRDSLLRIGTPVIPALAAYLERHGGRAAVPALEVAAGLPDSRLAPAARRLCADPLPEVRARAASLAGSLGGDEAVATLEGMLDDPDAEVRAAAASSLGRLGHWPAATRIAGLLGDPAWVVRSQSALALRRLGSPGLLFLRRGLGDADRFAADISRQVLDMPETTADRDQWR